jgi:hypothetical protein
MKFSKKEEWCVIFAIVAVLITVSWDQPVWSVIFGK